MQNLQLSLLKPGDKICGCVSKSENIYLVSLQCSCKTVEQEGTNDNNKKYNNKNDNEVAVKEIGEKKCV